MIATIERYVTRTYTDTGQVVATCLWIDETKKPGSTSGGPNSTHMQALKARAIRESVEAETETW